MPHLTSTASCGWCSGILPELVFNAPWSVKPLLRSQVKQSATANQHPENSESAERSHAVTPKPACRNCPVWYWFPDYAIIIAQLTRHCQAFCFAKNAKQNNAQKNKLYLLHRFRCLILSILTISKTKIPNISGIFYFANSATVYKKFIKNYVNVHRITSARML